MRKNGCVDVKKILGFYEKSWHTKLDRGKNRGIMQVNGRKVYGKTSEQITTKIDKRMKNVERKGK